MKSYLQLCLILIFGQLTTLAINHKIICYYDASSVHRKGLGQFTLVDLDSALEFCTHVVYDYAGINSLFWEFNSLNGERDIDREQFADIVDLRAKYPHIKFLLSLGGGKDVDLAVSNKYLQLLEGGVEIQKSFIAAVLHFLRDYKFDGLDLAFQFPRHSDDNKVLDVSWKSLRKLFIKKINETYVKDKDHKHQFSVLIENLKNSFRPYNLLLSLTVLPNVKASVYFNATDVINNLDFINLQTFDFVTPELSPTEATYTAPLYSLPVQGISNTQHSIDYQVNYWISQHIPVQKIIVGIAAYGRAWKMSNLSKPDGFPNVLATNGPAPASYITNLPGILNWAEICVMLPNHYVNKTGDQAPLLSVLDPHKDFVTYAFRPVDASGEHGIWISYDDPRIAAIKANYVKQQQLGGVALYDVSLDDFHGICNGDKFPMLRYIKYIFSY